MAYSVITDQRAIRELVEQWFHSSTQSVGVDYLINNSIDAPSQQCRDLMRLVDSERALVRTDVNKIKNFTTEANRILENSPNQDVKVALAAMNNALARLKLIPARPDVAADLEKWEEKYEEAFATEKFLALYGDADGNDELLPPVVKQVPNYAKLIAVEKVLSLLFASSEYDKMELNLLQHAAKGPMALIAVTRTDEKIIALKELTVSPTAAANGDAGAGTALMYWMLRTLGAGFTMTGVALDLKARDVYVNAWSFVVPNEKESPLTIGMTDSGRKKFLEKYKANEPEFSADSKKAWVV